MVDGTKNDELDWFDVSLDMDARLDVVGASVLLLMLIGVSEDEVSVTAAGLVSCWQNIAKNRCGGFDGCGDRFASIGVVETGNVRLISRSRLDE